MRYSEKNNKYCIVCDPKNPTYPFIDVMVMVDRNKAPDQWWTAIYPDIAMVFFREKAANVFCKKLKYNNPRVVRAHEILPIIERQGQLIMEEKAQQEAEMGWDSHKLNI